MQYMDFEPTCILENIDVMWDLMWCEPIVTNVQCQSARPG